MSDIPPPSPFNFDTPNREELNLNAETPTPIRNILNEMREMEGSSSSTAQRAIIFDGNERD